MSAPQKATLLLFLLCLTFISGCSRQPFIDEIVGTWQFEKTIREGIAEADVTGTIEFLLNGRWSSTIKRNFDDGGFRTYEESGFIKDGFLYSNADLNEGPFRLKLMNRNRLIIIDHIENREIHFIR